LILKPEGPACRRNGKWPTRAAARVGFREAVGRPTGTAGANFAMVGI